jgi:hypothetical protein
MARSAMPVPSAAALIPEHTTWRELHDAAAG